MKLQAGSRGSVRSSSAARRLHWRSTEQRWFKTRNWLREMVPSAKAMGSLASTRWIFLAGMAAP